VGNPQDNLLAEVIDAVKPLLTQDRRRGLLLQAFTGEAGGKVLDQIDFTGANDTFAPALVRHLILFGEIEPGRPAIVVLLESLGAGLGVDKRDRFNELIARLNPLSRQIAVNMLSQGPQAPSATVMEVGTNNFPSGLVIPGPEKFIFALCQLSDGQFRSIVLVMGISEADVGGADQHGRAVSVYNRVARPSRNRERNLLRLKSEIERYYSDAFANLPDV
jgi:hypothetical protein